MLISLIINHYHCSSTKTSSNNNGTTTTTGNNENGSNNRGLRCRCVSSPRYVFFSFLFSCSTKHYSLDYVTYYAYRTMTTHLLPGLCSYSSYQGHQTSKGGTSVEVLLHCPRARSGHTQLALAQGQQRVRPIGQGQGQARANPDPMTIQKKITCFIVLLQ